MMNLTRKLVSIFIMLVMMLSFQQCNNEDIKPAPSVLVDPISASNTPGETVSANLTIEAPNGAKSLSVFIAGIEADDIDLTSVDLSTPYPFEFTVPVDAVIGSKIVVSFQVIDNKNYPSAIANFVVTVGDPVITLQGTLATQTLVASKPYLLKGQVFVPSGVTLTIPAGTVIKGDKATKAVLVIQPGGKIMAEGTATNPVVFTSAQAAGERDRGDWGGIVLLGNAFVNQPAKPAIEGISPDQKYGNTTAEGATPTTNATENSGVLKYVRIEYAGVELTPNNETNSLTMGGVGNGTTIEYLQTSFGGDDSFEWFGGTVNAKYLISLSTWDDDFDTDYGWGGNVQFGLSVRNPFFADQSGSNAFESDNQGNGNAIAGICDLALDGSGTADGCTRGVFSNITILGPKDTNSRSLSANYQNTLHIRRRSSLSVFNSFFSGFRLGIRVDDNGTWYNMKNGKSVFGNNLLTITPNAGATTSTSAAEGLYITNIKFAAANDGTIDDASGVNNATSVGNWWTNTNAAFNNVTATSQISDLGISANLYWGGSTSSNYPSNPNFALLAGAAGANNLNGGSSFANAKVAVPFFTGTVYRGAFGSTDWTDGWSEFQPLTKAY